VLKAVEEMKAKSVVLNFKVEKMIDATHRNKLLDAKIILTPHPFFANEVKNANARQGRIKQSLGIASIAKTQNPR
jgi:ribosomal protein L31